MQPHHPNIIGAAYYRYGDDSMHVSMHQLDQVGCLRRPWLIVSPLQIQSQTPIDVVLGEKLMERSLYCYVAVKSMSIILAAENSI